MDLQQLAVSIRNVAEDPQRRETFVKTGLIEIKRLQRENSQLLEKNMSYLLNCLESFNVVDGPDADILCELTVLRILLGADLSSSQKEQCNSYVKLCLDSVRTVTVAVCAADVFAETLSYSIATDFLRTTVEDALQWMSLQENKKNIGRKVCGILILTEVALRLPMAILQKLGEIFDKLWDCLASSTGDIRARALRLFTLSTKLLCNRPTETRNEISASLMKCLKTHLNSKLREKKIAGLLAFEPIVINSTGANSYSLNYEDLSLLLVPFIVTGGNANSFPEVRALVFRCLVVLCRFNTTLFVANQLKDTVRFVLDSAKREDQMGVAFDILSEIVSVVGKTDFEPFVDECCTHLMNVFEESNPENPCWEALKCFATICKYCPPQRMKLYVDTCVDHIFSWRLSTVLVDCMRDIIAASDPTHQAKLEESLLDMISVTLCRLPFRQQGGVMKLNDIPVFSDVTSTQISVALNALVQFGFSDSELMGDFLRDSVLPLIDNSSPEVRSSAIKAIVSLLIPKGRKGDLSIGRRMCINTVLFRLLVVGLSDPSETIRTTILTSFTADFYPYLSEQQFLFRLFSALGDESIECRVAVLSQLCHMMTYDLSHILPALREEMVSILNSIHATFNPSIVEGGLRMLTAIASAAPQFINQYGDGVPDALRKHFSSINTQSPILLPFLECCTAVSKAIRTFGKRKNVFKYEIHYIIDLLDAFGAGTSLHQQRLGCLGFLSATLSPLIDDEYPYAIYPKLFPLLSSIIKQSSEPTDIRLEALRCVGAIGALDPHTFESTVTNEEESESNEKVIMFGKITHEKCCGVVLWSIASTLEANNAGLQTSTSSDNLVRSSLQTILRIADTCRCSWPRLRVVMAPLAKVIIDMSSAQRSERLLTTCLYEYSTIVYYVGDDITSELKSVYLIFDTIWNNHVGMRCLVVRLLSFLSYTEKGNQATKQSMRVLPQVFDALTDPPDRFNVELKYVILKYIVKHAQNLQSLCAPLVNSLLQSLRVYQRDQDYIHDAITALKVVCSKLYIEELVGVIVRTLLVCLAEDRKISTNMEKSTAISNNILGTFSILILELQSDFLKYSAYINQTLKACKITSPEFTALNNEIASGAKCVQNANATQALAKESARLVKKCENIVARYLARRGGEMLSSPNATVDLPGGGTVAEDKILVINEARILSSIKSVPLTREEWMKWSEQFSISILQESPYRVFRCTSLAIDNNSKPLVEISPYFTRNVLEVGFRTVWTYGSMSLRTSIVEFYRQVLRQSMSSSTVPDEVLAIILSIVEYMDHMGEVLSLEYSDLSDCAWSRGMLAKALYWREAAYRDSPAATVESLISLYSELEFVESSVGLMNLADEEQHKALLQSSLVKLARYTEALKLTKQELEAEATVSDNSGSDRISKSYAFKKYRSVPRMLHYNNNDSATSFGGVDETGVERRLEIHARLMLCLSELGNYHEVLDEWKKMYAKFKDADATDDGNLLFYLSQYAADASTRLQQWDTLEQVIPWMTKESVYYHIANATLQIVNNNFDEAVAHVADGRTMLLTDLSSLLHESYARAYTGIVVAQELTELEEVAAAKRCEIELGSSDHVHVVSRLWQQRIRLMSANVTVWKQILGVRGLLIPPKQDVTTRVRFVKLCRQEGASDLERFTLQQLIGARNPTLKDITSRSANLKVVMQWVTLLSSSNALGEGSAFGTESELLKRIIDTHYKAGNQVLLSRAYAKLGRKVERSEAVECYKTATLYDPKWYIAWRLWAEANTELLDVEYSDSACTNAIEGFIQSIKLGTSDSTLIQDVLKLLTLWSRHCDRERGLKELRIRVLNVSPRVWNLVVPQLIARLDLGSDDSCKLVAEIVAIVAYNYPHSLIYPLNLCTMSDSERRKKLADEILNVKLLDRYPVLVLQGSIVINELIRVSALIYEQWHEKLEMAANLFFGRNQRKEEMIQVLMPIHDTLNKVPETVVEADFFSSHAKALTEALEWVKTYKTSKNMADLQSAWNLYQVVYKRMDEQIKLSNTLKLQLCSPKLFEARDLSTGIPDTRSESEDGVSKIFSFHDVLAVIPSKQRPKRLGIFTHEGRSQKYLLKGREDLRLDERVMQLFGLVNILMTSDARSCNKYGFQIQRYSVTPLKDTVGVIGWVDACDTLHEVVKYYRERKSITTELEMRMLSRIITFDNVKAYDYLTVMSKVEVIEFLAAHTSGQDIRKAMWSSAPNCEVWMNRRKMYATSLANMSVVGYILGLGDRHPNNIMIQQSTGLVVHIDFGDCFEVAMTRDKFPEKVPFRLTRMLRNALDVSGVDGSFRSAAETSMCVLREGSHTVLALLEAFIQDPLISWRLMNRPGQEPEVSNDKTIEEQINIAKNMNPIQMQESVVESVDGGQRNDASPTLLKHLCCEEVDDVHQGVFILGRLSSKLKGEDFVSSYQTEPLDPKTQVGRLILEATDIANVAQSWSGWYPFW